MEPVATILQLQHLLHIQFSQKLPSCTQPSPLLAFLLLEKALANLLLLIRFFSRWVLQIICGCLVLLSSIFIATSSPVLLSLARYTSSNAPAPSFFLILYFPQSFKSILKSNYMHFIYFLNTVKAFVLTPKMTKNSIIFRGG